MSETFDELSDPFELPGDFNRPDDKRSVIEKAVTILKKAGMAIGLWNRPKFKIAPEPAVTVPSSVEFDFDGDNVADFARWEPS